MAEPMTATTDSGHFLQHAGIDYLSALTGLRGVVALWVAIYHIRAYLHALLPGMPNALTQVIDSGFIGVDIFFLLSAFIMSHVYGGMFTRITRTSYGYFLMLRLARIYPLHLLMLLAYGVAVLAFVTLGIKQPEPVERWSGLCFAESLILVQSWGFHDHSCFNGVAWSISVEWLAYLIFPFLVPLFARITSLRTALAGAVLALAAMHAYFWSLGSGSTLAFLGFATVPRMAGSFIAGCFLYRAYLRLPAHRNAATIAVILGWAGLWATLVFDAKLWTAWFCALLVLAHAGGTDPIGTQLSRPIGQYLGNISYALYISHFAVVDVYVRLFRLESLEQRPAWQLVAILVLYLAVILGIATLLHRLVEIPARYWLGRLAKRMISAP
ncbi:putative Acyltransferase 3 [Magnetospirillum sp. SS-4]|nr:putative Acyltransferase 3 [Magnetospirillum sp. SS-4]